MASPQNCRQQFLRARLSMQLLATHPTYCCMKHLRADSVRNWFQNGACREIGGKPGKCGCNQLFLLTIDTSPHKALALSKLLVADFCSVSQTSLFVFPLHPVHDQTCAEHRFAGPRFCGATSAGEMVWEQTPKKPYKFWRPQLGRFSSQDADQNQNKRHFTSGKTWAGHRIIEGGCDLLEDCALLS